LPFLCCGRLLEMDSQVVALFDNLHLRLLGIGLASFSSGRYACNTTPNQLLNSYRSRRINVPSALNDLLSFFCRRALCRVRPSNFKLLLTT
jgi:hypothetical protein